MENKISHPESGNVMFYILIAVALLAALIFAVGQSGRGSINQVNEEKAKLLSSEIIEYANGIANATAQLRLRGIKEANLCFNDTGWGHANYDHAGCTDDADKIFHLSGGGITWKRAPELAMDKNAAPDYLWTITGDNEVNEVGSTCGLASCADLILTVDELNVSVCKKLNELLHVTDKDITPPTDTEIGLVPYAGTFTFGKKISDEDNVLRGKTAACFQQSTAPIKYVFYKVLIAR